MMKISQEAIHWLSEMSGGDARCALSTLQILVESHHSGVITVSDAKEALQVPYTLCFICISGHPFEIKTFMLTYISRQLV